MNRKACYIFVFWNRMVSALKLLLVALAPSLQGEIFFTHRAALDFLSQYLVNTMYASL